MASRAVATHNGPPQKSNTSLGAPNQRYGMSQWLYDSCSCASSLYCTNLPDKLQKQDLRLSLYTLFSTYGPVLDVVALKTAKMRGQAHIVFRDIQASTQAMRALQGFDFFGKEMVSLVTWDPEVSAIANAICGHRKSNMPGESLIPLPSLMVPTAYQLRRQASSHRPSCSSQYLMHRLRRSQPCHQMQRRQ